MKPLLYFLLMISFFGCSGIHREKGGALNVGSQFKSDSNLVIFAKGFKLYRTGDTTYIVVLDPWHLPDTLATYMLLPKYADLSKYKDRADFILHVPVKRVASLSSTCLGMFKMLGKSDLIIASTNANMIYDSTLYHRYLNGSLTDLGEGMQLNAELIIGQNPDLVMKYIYGSHDPADDRIKAAGIPIAYNLEFMETHPLGRAEWIKFVAAFCGAEKQADSIFSMITKNYLALTKKTAGVKHKPEVLDGSCYKGVWYEAGGKSYPAKLYEDAGADYYLKNDSSRGSIPLSFETILETQGNAGFWFGPSSESKAELLGIESRYALLKSFKNGNVYQFGKRINPHGGLDYYESGVARPDILLKDLISVLHPELVEPGYVTVYLERVK